jgi:DNA-binding response OmpR family regulator
MMGIVKLMTATILLVDDERDLLELLTAVLRRHSYNIATARSAKQAFEYMENETPDLIILDVAMPEMSGTEMLRSLREDPRYSGVKVILLTAIPGVVTAEDAALADRVFAKPLTVRELESIVAEVLNEE